MTTNPLDAIQARFERADAAQDAYLEGRSIITAMVRSIACTADVPKLVAALRAVEAVEYPAIPDDFVYEMGYRDALKAIRAAIRGTLT